MREALALLRAGWIAALSYRVNLLFTLLGLGLMLVPLYFVAQALQPVAAASIQNEGRDYFGFLLIGLAVLAIVSTTVTGLPNTISSAIGSGTFEAILATPARLPAILLGLIGYEMSWSVTRAVLMLCFGAMLGSGLTLTGVPLALLALTLTLAAYLGISLGLAAMILVFRTVGPLSNGLLGASALLGGVYYSTTVIPSWVQKLSAVVPLTYGLRVIRLALLGGAGPGPVAGDLLDLASLAGLLLLAGGVAFAYGLGYARREGTLGQY
jgi:ABC-2 type transport system permease protein